MREIKFRVWDESIEEIVTCGDDRAWGVITNHYLLRTYPDDCIMQYTGLKDYNGQEIFEGDHWRYSDGSVETICDIIFEDGRWKAVRKEDGACMIWYYEFEILTDGEVAGNCYEN